MASESSPQHFQFVDALRGYAILGVILFHVGQVIPDAYPLLGSGSVGIRRAIYCRPTVYSARNRLHPRRPGPFDASVANPCASVHPIHWADHGLLDTDRVVDIMDPLKAQVAELADALL